MSLTYSPSNQMLLAKYGDKYITIGNATNIVIETARSKTPIFVFGKSEQAAIARGQQFINGTIDMVVFDTKLWDEILKSNKRIVSAVEQELNGKTAETTGKSIFGIDTLSYKMDETNIDDILLDELLLISSNPQPVVEKDENGQTHTYIEYMKVTLYDVSFFDYSYAKQISDVTALERVSFMAKKISPVNTYKEEIK